ncbi:F0F1 ATP synthase subunit delta [Roseiterribacter gracilis]|uniref:ATP synthase subunit delta n=1 Tax=Roseiterribacter gracilis TaxID=2812848 RepID=A0A8S8XF39_9PROT|nr:ATP synthase subunit delta [Rhodospirillales bacterium TMPK1]
MAASSGSSPIARRYAEALFELADEARALDQTASDLSKLKTMLAESADLRELVVSPVVGRDDQAKALVELAKQAGLGEIVQKFVGTLAVNRRAFALGGVINAFLAELANRRGEVAVEVTAAAPLTTQQQDALQATLAKRFGAKVSISPTVDPSLIGGLVVRVGSTLIDGSVRSQLEGLERTMKGVA